MKRLFFGRPGYAGLPPLLDLNINFGLLGRRSAER